MDVLIVILFVGALGIGAWLVETVWPVLIRPLHADDWIGEGEGWRW